ncbi:NapC/NirT cytochrome c domain protein [Thermodesulfatator indicus DSM 15286]|uniref:Cytochrome c-type protein n=1 Tax=Thermodesulfatator indicus (strain DSM 15286 / JCM 11887 / CIR29812) TaxID=667014 RepID=F8ADV5_THEID|nr:NapC/NirT family cytochrome c [Thermodesulfatator indicus]AEH46066.1 NapC/NirT cytochrome c domain protein [Thermodesulfatator indicus DSM 15286]
MNKSSLILGIIVGIVVAAFGSLIAASKIVSSNEVKFCASCHPMKTFYETWEASVHGPAQKGAMKAKCADCHLPHDGFTNYLITKMKAGLNDYLANMQGKGSTPQYWLERWAKQGADKHVYESSCRKCHQELVAPGIPLKAFSAHRQYELGMTKETCISCHRNVGHGNLMMVMQEKAASQKLAKNEK